MKKILVIEDEEDIAKVLKIRLKINGYDVVIASDSLQAFSMINDEKPDLIIIDIMIPGDDGFTVTERLKHSTDTHHIPILFLTGISGGQEKAFRMGASGYLMKPYHPQELLDTIHDVLEKTVPT